MARLVSPNGQAEKGRGSAPQPKRPHTLLISIAHGDLRLAKYPLAVGHYNGDAIVHAERRLDDQLGGRLTELFNMYLYPGPKGTAEVIHVPNAKPPGALVIGLGDVGELKPSTVRDGVANAALRHALAVLNDARREGHDAATQGWVSAGMSSLLLGTYGGNALSIEASLSSILQGVIRANEALRSQGLWDQVRIDEVQIVELYEDVALEAARAASYLVAHPPSSLTQGDALQVEPPYIHPLGNGRFQRPVNPYTLGWWRRIRITTEEREGVGRALRFLALTERARAEDTIQYTQRGFIEDLVRRSVSSTAYADELATVLFQLLMPNSIKDQTRAEADLLLVLDAASAQYPWELLADRTRNGIEPLGVRMGIIRQFQTMNFTANPQPARERNALVVGEPKSSEIPLPGARREAESVARLLSSAGYDVGGGALINPGSLEVLSRLFAKEYKILHLAGHGQYTADSPGDTGLILENGICLSPITIRNLSPLPELVFINCCHLGRLDDGTQQLKTDTPHALAASLAEELINMGVKAVVAAGWAVDDEPAKRFAEVFYELMLSGVKFGAAVKEARIAARAASPTSNTWGAYQCYGNPDFVLERAGDGSESSRPQENRCFTRSEYLERLADIASDASRADAPTAERLRQQLEALDKGLPDIWRDGAVLRALGAAYAELENYEQAIQCYRATTDEEKGHAPLSTIAQLANLLVNYARALHASPSRPPGAPDPDELIEEAVRRLEWLLQLGESTERLSLLGGCYKRKAAIASSPEDKRRWLEQAKNFYGQAHAYFVARKGRVNAYPALNWLACRFLLGESVREDFGVIEQCKASARKAEERESSFWNRVTEADAELLLRLAAGDLGENVSDVLSLYQRAFRAGVTPRDRAIVTQHLEFLHDMLSSLGAGRPDTESSLAALKELRDELG